MFLGAGASASFGYPTTKKFIEELKSELGNSIEKEFLSYILNIPNFTDVEHVLELLDSLQFLNKHPVKEFFAKYKTTIQLDNRLLDLFALQNILDSLREKILSDVYRQYEFSPNTLSAVLNAYNPLLDMIYEASGYQQIPIFTTNYDRVIEEWCNHNRITYFDGFSKESNTEEFEWHPTDFDKEPTKKKTIQLFKLHGSLNWRRLNDGRPVKIGAEERTRGSRRFKENVLIYPAEKVKPEIEPFRTLHEKFKKKYNESDIVIFLGYAFRDQYLNDIISSSFNSKAKRIIVVSPHASKLSPQFGANSSFIEYSFGEEKTQRELPKLIYDEIQSF